MSLASRAAAASVIALCFLSCEKPPQYKSLTYTQHDRTRSSAEAQLPASLWEKIVSQVQPDQKRSASAKGALPTAFVPITVRLIEKNKGILTDGHAEIEFGPGGGELDLREFLQAGKNGSFYLVVDFAPEVEKKDRKVYFLSNGIKRKRGSETLGAGCDAYFDVSTGFDKAMRTTGLLVNTTDGRHVSTLAGTFFFSALHQGKLQLASLTVTDSSHRSLQCH